MCLVTRMMIEKNSKYKLKPFTRNENIALRITVVVVEFYKYLFI